MLDQIRDAVRIRGEELSTTRKPRLTPRRMAMTPRPLRAPRSTRRRMQKQAMSETNRFYRSYY
ncbi:hypothetical protein BMJ32_00170 [Sinorhizobium medicae]|nr:hypothetical protein BMJ32_00170 [Sinorhizobium medicae]PLU58671.1 hypothetical protein BMJ23_05010 [Sinorhizobium medicae]PLU74778.1 hypothetical protein BMJ21_03020 [Sinorhizobium medicae]PLU80209.1 hypothetical protein BMJ22_18015 [Sinorhizobium medicae]